MSYDGISGNWEVYARGSYTIMYFPYGKETACMYNYRYGAKVMPTYAMHYAQLIKTAIIGSFNCYTACMIKLYTD